ncbi:MAG: hypothetical protein QXK88_07315 [Desulfurococcaceae archaeon]
MAEGSIDISLATAEEILSCAKEEFRRALKTGDVLLYRNTVDKAFLSMRQPLRRIKGLSPSLRKRIYVKSIREVNDTNVIKFMNLYVDVELLIGWLFRRLRKHKRD